MKKPSSTGRARLVVAALIVAAAGVFASVGMAGYGAKLVGLEHQSPTANQYPTSKVTICHHTHSKKNPFVTITVSQNAVAAHVRNHGDTIGPCPAQPPSVPAVPPGQAKKALKVRKAHKAKHAAKLKLHQHGTTKAEHGSHANNGHAKAVGHKPATAPATVHGKGNAKGHVKTHGQSANHGQGQAKGHGHDKTQPNHGQGQGHGQGNGDAHKNSGGGTGNGKGNGH